MSSPASVTAPLPPPTSCLGEGYVQNSKGRSEGGEEREESKLERDSVWTEARVCRLIVVSRGVKVTGRGELLTLLTLLTHAPVQVH